MATSAQQNLSEKNKEYAAHFDKPDLPVAPVKKYAVVVCMDARIDPQAAFGIALGDAHIIRNGGGSALDALRSLVASQQVLGTQEVILVKHTDCGFTHFDTPHGTELVEKNLGAGAKEELWRFAGGKPDFLTFTDPEQAAKDDVQLLKNSKLIKDDIVLSGWVYEVKTGKVRQVV